MTRKVVVVLTLCVSLLMGIVLTGCEPTENLVPAAPGDLVPGNPITVEPQVPNFNPAPVIWPGTNTGEEIPGGKGRILAFADMPPVSYWNNLGHQHAFPDPFTFANGQKVETIPQWEMRHIEISRIMQYYIYGVMPTIKEEDGVTITYTNSGTYTAPACAITVTYQGRTYNRTLTVQNLPATAEDEDSHKYGVYFGGSASATSGSAGQEMVPNGSQLRTLYNLPNDGSAPSDNMAYAWWMSVMLTVMEDGGWYGLLNPEFCGVTGGSRNGKAALCQSAFAESRGGKRLGHVNPFSAGSGGPAMERFLSPSGYVQYGKPADPMPLDGPGIMEFIGLIGKPWYIKKINDGDPFVDPEMGVFEQTASNDDVRFRLARGWAPYFEEYTETPPNNSGTGNHTSATIPFVGWQSPAESWSGIQSLAEARAEVPGWFSNRFQEFADLHFGLDMDHVVGNETRTKHGVLCTMPLDEHYLGVLVAPRGIMYNDGYIVPRNNPESQFANWLISDEVYKFYGEQEGDPEKYIWRNTFIMNWGTHMSGFNNIGVHRGRHADAINNGTATTETAKANPWLAALRDPYFQVDDPIGRFDYYRMPFGRPGHPTIAERVYKRVNPILKDYHAGEGIRPAPLSQANGGSNAQPADDAKYPEGYVPTGIKFKEMDWRGLLDDPELMEGSAQPQP